MAISTVQVTGHIKGPDGVAPTGGALEVKLSQPASTLDGAEAVRVVGETRVVLTTGGVIPAGLLLVPVDAMTPSGVYYLATYSIDLPDGRRYTKTEKWAPVSGTATIDIGAIPQVGVLPGVALGLVSPGLGGNVSAATATATGGPTKTMAEWTAHGPVETSASLVTATGSTTPDTLANWAQKINLQWYVDSVNGSDANDGRSAAAPLATIAALLGKTILAGSTINLARGSKWREQISGLADGVSVVAYGEGPRPLLDCSTVAANANFSKTGGYTNIYQIAWSHSLNAADVHRVWVGGTRLTRAASLAACDGAAGSFYAAAPTTGGPDTVYVNSTGSTNPTSDGKVYELASREYGINGPVRGGQIIGIHTRRNASVVASLVSRNYAKDCLAEDGYYHNMWVEGLAEDCTAWGIEPPAVAAALFVTYASVDGAVGATYRRTKAIAGVGDGSGVSGYIFHAAVGCKLKKMAFEDCEVTACVTGFNGANCDNFVLLRPQIKAVKQGIVSTCLNTKVYGGLYNAGMRWTAPWANPDQRTAIYVSGSTPATLTVRGFRAVTRSAQPGGGIIWVDASSAVAADIRYSTLVGVDMTGYTVAVYMMITGHSLTFRNNVVALVHKLFETQSGVTLDSNDNVISPATMDVRAGAAGGTEYATIALYQAALATQDTASSITDPTFVGSVRGGDVAVGEASAVWTVGATAVGAGATFLGDTGDQTLMDAFYRAAGTP